MDNPENSTDINDLATQYTTEEEVSGEDLADKFSGQKQEMSKKAEEALRSDRAKQDYLVRNPNSKLHHGGNKGVPVKIKTLPHGSGLPKLKQATSGSSGFDLCAALDEVVFLNTCGSRAVIPTGISIELPEGYEAQIRPRSGLAANHGISIVNTPGTIDADYRGEIKIILVNLSTNRFKVERGMRIAQMVIQAVPRVDLQYVDDLSNTERGEGHFGSTGA